MWSSLFPDRASTMAGRVDALFAFLVAMSACFVILIAGFIVYFAIRYRRRSQGDVGTPTRSSLALELTWTLIPAALAMVLFVWGASVYYSMGNPPPDTIDIYVVAKQWMWKFQHLNGRREIDELHVPVGRAVKLTLTSEDVIHDLYVPAFRIKGDVVPGRYMTIWFQVTKPGRYPFFCAEYCGTKHSAMVGSVVAMDVPAYEAWLGGGAAQGGGPDLAQAGQKLFGDLGCASCHRADDQGRGPGLAGLGGGQVKLNTGQVVTADDAYIRESILDPGVKVVDGFRPIMPTYRGLVGEEQLVALLEYIKSLRAGDPAQPSASGEPGGRPGERRVPESAGGPPAVRK
jgi:cytochrome c oxidase subunit II